jgi:signal transduction histidine kinase
MRTKNLRDSLLMLLLFTAAMAAFTATRFGQERRQRREETLREGSYLANLVALYPMDAWVGERRPALLRTLAEHITRSRLAYLFVHDARGIAVVQLVPGLGSGAIPPEIESRSLYADGSLQQTYRMPGERAAVYEFARPVFSGGAKSGTVRLGLRPAPVNLLSAQHASLLGLLGFLMLAALIVGYYLIVRTVQGLKNVAPGAAVAGAGAETALSGLLPVIEHLDRSVTELKTRLREIALNNTQLTSQLGVAAFEKDQMFRALDALEFGVIVLDLQDNVTHANRSAATLLGRRLGEIADQPLEAVAPPEMAAYVAEHTGTRRGGDEHLDLEFPGSPGEQHRVGVTPLKDAGGGFTGKLVHLRNVSRTRRAEEAQRELIAQLAHELLTPLTTMKTYSEMLMDGEVRSPAMQGEFYNTINEEADRLSRLIQNLLNIAKMEMGTLTLSKGLVKTDWLIETTLPAVEAAARDKHIAIQTHAPDRYPAVVADKELLKVVLVNILGNAVKYTPENGAITFSLQDEETAIVFEIADTGYGILSEDLPHIFDKFYRSQDPKIRAQPGSGLGLATAAQIVRLHGGSIEVHSEVGRGTRFTIRLPKEKYVLANA